MQHSDLSATFKNVVHFDLDNMLLFTDVRLVKYSRLRDEAFTFSVEIDTDFVGECHQ